MWYKLQHGWTWKHYVNGKNPDKRLLLYDSTYMPCLDLWDRKKIRKCLRVRMGARMNCKWAWRHILKWSKCSNIGCLKMVAQFYKSTKNYWIFKKCTFNNQKSHMTGYFGSIHLLFNVWKHFKIQIKVVFFLLPKSIEK